MVVTPEDPAVPTAELRWPDEESGLRRAARNLGMRAAGRLGAGGAALFRQTRPLCSANATVGILTYHRVANPVRGLPEPLHNVTPQRFRQQLSGLLQRGFQFISIHDLLEKHRRRENLPPRTAAVTFDDGFGNVYTDAWPVLSELNVPATVFVNTAYLGLGAPFPFDSWGVAFAATAPPITYLPLSEAECHEMAGTGLIAIGPHTHTHQDFRGRPAQFYRDLQQSVDFVRDRFQVGSPAFAFPFGSVAKGFCTKDFMDASKRLGCSCALTMECELVDVLQDPFGWGRFNVFPWDTDATLAAKLQGWYSWAPRLWQRLSSTVGQRPGEAKHA